MNSWAHSDKEKFSVLRSELETRLLEAVLRGDYEEATPEFWTKLYQSLGLISQPLSSKRKMS